MGATTLQPGEESAVTVPAHKMTGAHLFEISVTSNDPVEPVKVITIRFVMTD